MNILTYTTHTSTFDLDVISIYLRYWFQISIPKSPPRFFTVLNSTQKKSWRGSCCATSYLIIYTTTNCTKVEIGFLLGWMPSVRRRFPVGISTWVALGCTAPNRRLTDSGKPGCLCCEPARFECWWRACVAAEVCLLRNGRVSFVFGSVWLDCGSVVLNLTDECNNRGFDSIWVQNWCGALIQSGFKIGVLDGS